jgi:hypothetical protein
MESQMTDAELIDGFESTTLPAGQFTHEAHVRVAWWYLTHLPMLEAVTAFSAGLRRFASANGAAGKYHETVTVAWMLLIASRLVGREHSVWTEFARRNPDLFVQRPSPLAPYYSAETLASQHARNGFLLPSEHDTYTRSRGAHRTAHPDG